MTFAGLFNGALSEGWFAPIGLVIGKAECEWGWPDAWKELKNAGLIEFETFEKPNHPRVGGITKRLKWNFTAKGLAAREEDLRMFEEQVSARR